jgi:hypothetical protein
MMEGESCGLCLIWGRAPATLKICVGGGTGRERFGLKLTITADRIGHTRPSLHAGVGDAGSPTRTAWTALLGPDESLRPPATRFTRATSAPPQPQSD